MLLPCNCEWQWKHEMQIELSAEPTSELLSRFHAAELEKINKYYNLHGFGAGYFRLYLSEGR